MEFQLNGSEADFSQWLASDLTEDALRDAYVAMEAERASLWAPGHANSFRRDRYELDGRLVTRLVQIKRRLAAVWEASGQISDAGSDSVLA